MVDIEETNIFVCVNEIFGWDNNTLKKILVGCLNESFVD